VISEPAVSFLPEPGEKKRYVKTMFDGVASKYDFLNHLLSLGIDIYWRREALRCIDFGLNPKLLDLATGTGDMALMAVKRGALQVVGVDLSSAMLEFGQKKILRDQRNGTIQMVCGEGENLPLPDASLNAATIAFGIRNVSDIQQTLNEMARVLTQAGVIVVLEFSQPRWPVFKQLYHFYSMRILPAIGSLFSSDKKAYHYLPESVLKFPNRKEFAGMIEKAGFTDIRYFDMTLGVVTVYCGIKM
jgi:demethylmenaquinone methyltransferase/2-methoxy-6-polyprenyl-1,4-benzoquinol methylase